jgi:mRNA-degrading endonuclease toxin of MazEF toxin-antitoxin module
VSKRTYIPQRGDLIHLNLGNTGGSREFDGPHYALVISQVEFQRRTGMCIVLPTTSREHPELGPLAVKLPVLEGLKKDGWVHLHHVRSVDYRDRSAVLQAQLNLNNTAHREFLDDLIDRLFSVVE